MKALAKFKFTSIRGLCSTYSFKSRFSFNIWNIDKKISLRSSISVIGMQMAGMSACTLCFKWKIISGFAKNCQELVTVGSKSNMMIKELIEYNA